MKIELNGRKAIAAVVVIAAAIVWKFAAERSTLATEAADELKFWLRAEYLAAGMEGFDPTQLSEEEAQARGEELLSLSEIEFSSIGARGRGDDLAQQRHVVFVQLPADERKSGGTGGAGAHEESEREQRDRNRWFHDAQYSRSSEK